MAIVVTPVRLVPVVSFLVGLLTYVICVAYALGSGQYIGGMSFPYFSDTGREPPMYWLFALGLTATAFLMVASNVLWFVTVYIGDRAGSAAVSEVLGCSQRGRIANAALKFVILSAPFMVILGWFSTIEYPTVHDLGAYVFFVAQLLALILYTVSNNIEASRASPRLMRTVIIRNVIAGVYFVCFLVYLPIGLAVNCEWTRLSMDACVNTERLGEAYCAGLELQGDPASTKLWDYTACAGTNTMRAVFQFLTIISLLAYYGTFALDLLFDDHEDAAGALGVKSSSSAIVQP